jgi:hypothetical protein
MQKGILLHTLTPLELILTFWNPLPLKHISKSNEIAIINTCEIILIFDYLGNIFWK